MTGSLDVRTALERFRLGDGRPVLLDRQRAQAIRADYPALLDSLLEAADSAIQPSFRFFGYPDVTLDRPIDWHYDPISNVHWPQLPSERINHRVFDGDVKWIWELNRLQHLPWLAQAWLFTDDVRYERAAFEHLDSWIDQNPPGHGIAWRGAFEAGIRAVSIAVALQGLRDSAELTVDRFDKILAVLNESARRCWQDRSLYSSANNHLVGEMAGLAVIALMFPEFPQSSEWEVSAVQILCAEAERQILPDGVGAEQAIGYQMFTVELMQVVAVLLLQRDGRAPRQLVDAISRSTSFLAGVIGQDDPPPRYGDDDEGFALRLGPEGVRDIRDHLGIVSVFDWASAGKAFGNETLTSQWYRVVAPRSSLTASTPVAEPQSFVAPDGGLVVLRSGRRRTMMDVGPLGYLSIAAHGHADALAVTVSADGQEIIGDPGTGSYYGHPEWRSAMRGTRAHATVCIDDQDQSINAGAFMWLRHARTHVREIDLNAGVVDAEHDGYTRLPGGPVHRRLLIAPGDEPWQLVVDVVTGTGSHEVRASWPLHPSLEVERISSGHNVSRQGSAVLQLLYASNAPLVVDEVRGDTMQNLGWWSDRLESRTPSWWLGAVANVELPVVIATLLAASDGYRADGLSVEVEGDRVEVQWSEEGERRAVTIPVRTGEVGRLGRAVWVSTSLSTRGGISTYVRNVRETDLWRSWDVHHVATHCNGGTLTRCAMFVYGFGDFVWHLITRRPQIAHIHMSSYGSFVRKFLVMWTAKAFRLPVVLHVHGSRFNEFADGASRPGRLLIRTALEHADAVIALGSHWAEELHRIAPNARIEVVPNAVRLQSKVQQDSVSPAHVVFLGEVGERKGTFALLEAWAKLVAHTDCPPVKLTIAGDGEIDRLRNRIAELGIDASVEVRGWLSEYQVAALLNDVQVLVLPSMNEGQPMAILEAMSRGICVVASTVGGIPEMLSDSAGILVEPDDTEMLASALLQVVSDSDARARYGASAYRRIEEEFNIEIAADRIDKIYRTILQRRNIPRD
ncbi:heparinase II/III domain-containing protein [Mycolicibacterium anyangense]|uniref:heparinase II/III domain-containing protein n=1 Tax=Mycolicibacterium anyangense TaxID=1431246 RepID=UPI001FE694F7|nr:heparinase II/III family protein [Mycolicibacterium anyangense]